MLEDSKERTTIKWYTGSRNKINFKDITNIIKERITKGATVYIGSDSFVSRGKVCFATTICLHGNGTRGRYFFFKENLDPAVYTNLVTRITEETRRSIKVAEILMSNHGVDPTNIEVHLDVSPFSSNNGTSKHSEMLKGYVSGYGLECKLKPFAWASQSVADKHSK